jgi:TonB family protein
MPPLSLLFSSDQETSRELSQILRDLDFRVELCSDIFSAVDKITARSFDVVISDWHEGAEAGFLLQAAHELRANQQAMAIGLAAPDSVTAAYHSGADLVLTRPIEHERSKRALLESREFLAHMQGWLPKLGFVSPTPPKASLFAPVAGEFSHAETGVTPEAAQPLPLAAPPDSLAQAMDIVRPIDVHREWFRPPDLQAVLDRCSQFERTFSVPKRSREKLLTIAAAAVAIFGIGYAFSGAKAPVSVAKSTDGEAWFASGEQSAPAGRAQDQTTESKPAHNRQPENEVVHIRVTPQFASERRPTIHEADESAPEASTAPETRSSALMTPTAPVRIPDSLKTKVHGMPMTGIAARYGQSLAAAMEPVSLSEEISQKLLLQKVNPSYPLEAIKAGLQGPVVLKALISRDGVIRDLKLVRGSFLLGQAAYKAVRQWRYQPFVVNGKAMEAQTYVTVDFRLPQLSQSNQIR